MIRTKCLWATDHLPSNIKPCFVVSKNIRHREIIDSKSAYEIGLITDIFDQEKLLEEALKIASDINSKSSNATKYIIKSVNEGISLDTASALKLESSYFKEIFEHEDRKIGISSFLDKKKPIFRN